MSANFDQIYSPTSLHHMTFVLQQLSDEILLKEVGISLSHVRILGVLDSKVPYSQRVIASKLHQTEANVSRQLLAMVRQRLVKIAKNKQDARQHDITLSAKGARKYEQAEKLLKKQLNTIYKNFNKTEKRDFEDAVARIIKAL
jgi:DNA-binding MarR family transcriptional regulator